jgi:peptidoglycan biosynthesis protein MviN/MurJ (putative lipid II flippase)
VDVPGLVVAGLLVLAGVVHTELAAGIERRRRGTDPAGADLSSVWTFAAAVLLVPALIGAVVVLVHLHLWQRVWRRAGMAPHRYLYTTAAVVLAGCAAHAVVASVGVPAGGTGPARVAGSPGPRWSTWRSTRCWSPG